MRYGYLIGLIYFGGSFWWISNVTVIGVIVLILYLALYPAMWFLLVARLVRPPNGKAWVLLEAMAAAALWVALEWWRSWFLTGFNWNELGISQAPSIVFRQLAAFGGVPLISFVLVTVNILWAEGLLAMVETFHDKRVIRASVPFALALLVVAICFALGGIHLRRHQGEPLRSGPTYACVQPNTPQMIIDNESWKQFLHREDQVLDKQEQLSTLAVASKPDLLIWPEATTGEEIFQQASFNEMVHRIATSFDGYFLIGSQESDVAGRKVYNTAYLFGPGWDRFQYYRKTKLVLLGEFVPFSDTFPWLHKALDVGMDMTPGPGPVKFVMEKPEVTLSPLICFEDTAPDVVDKAARKQPDFFVTITNDGWYWGWTAQWGVRQHLAHAIFRCVEHDRPMIRCANNGISCEIDQNGTVVDRFRAVGGADVDVGGIFSRKLEFYPAHSTLHEAWGDWIVLISALISGMLGLRFFYRFHVRKHSS